MNDCYQNNYKNYDWLIFYEIDEFIYLKGFNDIKNYLSQTKFDKCEAVQLNWVHRSDNNKIYYESKPVQERFPEKGKNVVKDKKNPLCDVKTIVRGHLNNIRLNDCHLISNNLKGCNGFGNKSQLRVHTNLIPDYDFFYINHYFGKSTEEFVNKIKRGDILRGHKPSIINLQIYRYFVINKLTSEKLKYIENNLGFKINLTKYWNLLKSNSNIK